MDKLLFVYKSGPSAGQKEDATGEKKGVYLSMFKQAMAGIGLSPERVVVARSMDEVAALWAKNRDSIGFAVVHTDEKAIDVVRFIHRQQQGVPVAVICPYGDFLLSLSVHERQEMFGGDIIVSDDKQIYDVVFPRIVERLSLPDGSYPAQAPGGSCEPS